MTFLKFLEKDKKREGEAPPSLPQLPPLPDEGRVPHMRKPLPPLPPLETQPGLPERPAKPLFDISPPEGEPFMPAAPSAPKGPLFPEVQGPPEELPSFPKIEQKRPVPPKIIEEIEEKEFRAERRELEELKKRMPKPIFIEINDFKEVLEFIGEIKNELKNGDSIMFKIDEIKNLQDKKYESWNSVMHDLQRKFIYVEKTIFETKYVR